MDREKFEQIQIPENLTEAIRAGIEEGEKVYQRNRKKKFWLRAGGCAAAVLLCFGVFAAQPVLASKVPVVREIFKLFHDNYSYQGDLDAVAEKLEEPAGKSNGNTGSGLGKSGQGGVAGEHSDLTGNNGETEETINEKKDGKYTKTVDGITITLSEAYCSGEAIYFSMLIVSEEGFPATAESFGEPIICIRTVEKYPFTDAENPGFGFGYLEGDFLDANTFAGIYRIDIMDITGGDNTKKEQLLSGETLPMTFEITQLIGDRAEPDKPDMQGKTQEELEAMTDEEWDAFMKEVYSDGWDVFPNTHEHWWYEGPFTFELELKVDTENLNYVVVDEMNENGAGLYSVSRSKFEITVEQKNSEERTQQGTHIEVLDADGKQLPRGSSQWGSTFAINGRDVSTAYVYICDAEEYLEELRGYREQDNFKEILDERALYSKEIHFDDNSLSGE